MRSHPTPKLTVLVILTGLSMLLAQKTIAQNIQIEEPTIRVSTENNDLDSRNSANLHLLIGSFGEREFLKNGAVAQIGIAGMKDSDSVFRFRLNTDVVTDQKTILGGEVDYDTPSQYRVYVGMNGLPMDAAGEIIPITRCSLYDPCSVSKATRWEGRDIEGVGYTVSGNDTASDFQNNHYRPFVDTKKNSVLNGVIESAYLGKDRSFELKNKVNLKTSKNNKTYQTSITILGTPGY